jgi:hypothetical protein
MKVARILPTNCYVIHGPAQWYETGRLQWNNVIDSLIGLAHVPIVVSGNLEHLSGSDERNEGQRKKEQSALARQLIG